MRTFALCSGSSGNAFYVENSYGDKILIDIGVSFRRAKQILAEKGIDINEIDGVFITHEHTDHVKGLRVFSRNVDAKVFMTKGTADAINVANYRKIRRNKKLRFKNFEIFPIEKPHDAADPVSYVIKSDEKSVGIFTDIGRITSVVRDLIKGLNVVYFEANYSEEFIEKRNSSYASRCISEMGHLDTEDSLSFICDNLDNSQKVVFCHISENHNTYENVNFMFKELLEVKRKNIEYFICYQKEPTSFIDLRGL